MNTVASFIYGEMIISHRVKSARIRTYSGPHFPPNAGKCGPE